MKNSEKYYTQSIYELRDIPLLEKTVLFIESYDEPVHGDCEAILLGMLSDERFTDWKFQWCIPQSVEYDPERKEDPRINCVSYGSHDFVEACEKNTVIVTAERLPEYYIKKSGQFVIGCFPISFFYQKPEVTRDRTLLQTTLEKLDVLYTDNEYVQERLCKMYPEGIPFQVIRGIKPRFALPSVRNEEIVVSLSTAAQGKRFSDLERKYKECKYICVQHCKEVCFHVDKSLYRSFQLENEPEILRRIISRETSFCRVAKDAELIITNRILNVYDAVQMHIPCIYVSDTRFLPEYFKNQNTDQLFFADNWEEALGLMNEHISDLSYKAPVEEIENGVINILNLIAVARKSVNDMRGKGELWIVPGDIFPGFWKAMEYYKREKDVSIFVRSSSNGILWKRHIELTIDKKIFCKIGMCASDSEGRHTETIMRREWQRMIGEKSFETAYLWEDRDSLWNELYQYVPANKTVGIDKEKTAAILCEGMIENFIGKLSATDVNGNKYYGIGRDEDKADYYLDAKSDMDKITVIFINKPDDPEKYRAMISNENDGNMSYVFIDPRQYMRNCKRLDNHNIYWIPKNIFSLHLLSVADHIWGNTADCVLGEGFKILD